MSGNEISYHVAMDMMEEFRLIMKRFHKKSDAPYRKPEVQMKKIKEKNILVYLKKESNALNHIEKLMKLGSNICGINLMLEKRKHLIYC